jgi:tetratricopeptide (TPR) repeat protein
VERERTDPWNLVLAGEFARALLELTKAVTEAPDSLLHRMNRGVCLLALHRLENALEDFESAARTHPENAAGFVKAGVVLWWLRERQQAVSRWREALNASYTDAAGIEVPALLLFTATREEDESLEVDATRRLKKQARGSRIRCWPGPIAQFLLGEMDEESLLNLTSRTPILHERELAQAHFWIGVQRERQGDSRGYRESLAAVVEKGTPSHRSVILEHEFWLARAELELGDGR